MMYARTLLAGAALSALALSGCADDGTDPHHQMISCDEETRADTYVAGLEKTGAELVVSLVSDPAPPAKGDNTWTLTVTDMNGDPVDGLTIDSDPFMPDHGHGTPIQESVTAGDAAGEYVLAPINLWMPGYWEVTIDLSGEGISDAVTFAPCIDG